MSRNTLVLIAAAGSAALLIGALGFQYIGGLPPCKLCYWQRYPHVVAVLIGAAALLLPGRILPLLGACAALATAGVGLYHTGVERGWWEGPTTCTSGPIGGLSTDALLDQIMAAPLVRCDDIAWELLTLSMASWNALASVALALIWIAAARR
ncbi:disulfide bond formation protein B [Puniceibacterium confluentis]|uniref:disulfide bond formation protein B n=1 Tax=Puniceibacterium confluentis TaxID=1958944 RepID=UPI0011B7CE81|nr:disulfide bond formation protein B [Puniceibacterium confluentis]